MPSIFDIFQSQLGEGQLEQIAKQIGVDKSKTRDAMAMTRPTMIEALARLSVSLVAEVVRLLKNPRLKLDTQLIICKDDLVGPEVAMLCECRS